MGACQAVGRSGLAGAFQVGDPNVFPVALRKFWNDGVGGTL